MNIVYRPAKPVDLRPAVGVVFRAGNDLRTRNGGVPAPAPQQPHFQAFCLAENPGGLWVAEADGTIVGFGCAWMIGAFWFLSQLFIEPGLQAKGVGQALMSRTLDMAERNGADNRTLITFAYNLASTGLYMQNGLYPREPLYRMAAPAAVVAERISDAAAEAVPLAAWNGARDWINGIDDAVLGFRRESHHRFQLGGFAARALEIRAGGRPLGYAYISGAGHIGPLAVAPGADAKAVVVAAIRSVLDSKQQRVSMVVAGRADRILELALGLGFRIDEPYVLMSARPFGRWDHYLPSNPGYM